MTAHASANTGTFRCGATNTAAAMNATLSSTGANAGSEKLLYVFSTPEASVVSEMNTMYGNMICVIVTASGNACPSVCRPDATANTTHDAPAIPTTDSTASAHASTVDIASTSAFVASCPCWFLNSARIGTNACENAPSADRRRSRFGIRKAT